LGERDISKEYELLLVRHFLYIEADNAVRRCISYVFLRVLEWNEKVESELGCWNQSK